MEKLRYLALALSIFLMLSIIPEPLLGPVVPKIPNARAVTVPIALRGFATSGWNGSSLNPNPTITVHAFDTVKLSISSADAAPHQFLLDGNKDGCGPVCSTDCLSPHQCSMHVHPSTSYTFSIIAFSTRTYPSSFHIH